MLQMMDGKEHIYDCTLKFFVYLNLWYSFDYAHLSRDLLPTTPLQLLYTTLE